MSLDTNLEDTIRVVRDWIQEARSVVVLTGAGISTDSGIPDFRGPDGLWTKNPEAEKMATLQHYMGDPEVRKRAWKTRGGTFARRAEPNVGHHALVELERRGKLDTLITQNVDGLHVDAGTSVERVVKMLLWCRCGRSAAGMSVVEPLQYAQRFLRMIDRILPA